MTTANEATPNDKMWLRAIIVEAHAVGRWVSFIYCVGDLLWHRASELLSSQPPIASITELTSQSRKLNTALGLLINLIIDYIRVTVSIKPVSHISFRSHFAIYMYTQHA